MNFTTLAGLYKTEKIELEVYYDGNPEYADLIKRLNTMHKIGMFEGISKYLSRVAWKEERIFELLWECSLIGIRDSETHESFHYPDNWKQIQI